MISLRSSGYVTVGMIIADVNGNESVVTDIFIPSSNLHVLMSVLPVGNDLVLELNREHYLTTFTGWENLDERIKIRRQ